MTHRHRVSARPSDEHVLHDQGNTVLVDGTHLSNVPPSPDRSEPCGTSPYDHGICDVWWPEERQR